MSSDAAYILDNLPAAEDIPQWMIDKGRKWTPELWDKLHEIATSNPSVKVRLVATKQIFDRVYGKPAVRQRIEGGVEHRHFVLRAPTVIEDAGAWEAHASAWQAADRARTIDLLPEPPAGPEPAPELPVVPVPEPRPPVPPHHQGHTLTPSVYGDMTDPAQRRNDLALQIARGGPG